MWKLIETVALKVSVNIQCHLEAEISLHAGEDGFVSRFGLHYSRRTECHASCEIINPVLD